MKDELYLALYLYYPQFRNKMDLELISDLRIFTFIDKIKDLLGENRRISIFELSSLNIERGDEETLSLIKDVINSNLYKHLFFTEATTESETVIKDLTEALQKQKNHKELLRKLNDSYLLASKYNYNEMYSIIKNISQEPKSKLLPTKTGMLLSLMDAEGFYTGIPEIDDDGGLLRKNIMTIAGDSGMEKTMSTLSFVIDLLIRHKNMKAGYFEKEMPRQDIDIRLWSRLLNMNSSKLRKNIADYNINLDKYTEVIQKKLDEGDELAEALTRLHVIDKNQFDNAVDVLKYIETYNLDIWVLDYLTMLSDGRDDYNKYIEDQVLKLKQFSDSTNTFGIILSQLKQTSDIEGRENKIPLISDMEYGKKLRQLSSWVYVLFKPAYYGYQSSGEDWFYWISRKTRHGKPKIIPFVARPEICKYNEPTEEVKLDMLSYIKKYSSRIKKRG